MRHARVAARLQPRLLEVRIARAHDRLAALGVKKRDCLARLAASRRARYEGAAARLRPTPVLQRIARTRDTLEALEARSVRALANRMAQGRQRLEARSQMLSALSYQGVLARGFAIVRDGNGAMVRRAGDAHAGAALGIEFHDGDVRVQAIEDGRERPGTPPKASRAKVVAPPRDADQIMDKPPVASVRPSKPRGTAGGGGQGSLF